ncbi:hypothetical protein [Aurantiacibacter spongiae]|uniref:hypothetical protein n=1 Tax=Aurantiacibacter spongiae TaxID=2488860 RepID=UPI0013157D6B|nr:hypothetical protein [Aurantiacibacter spongiae]
MTQHTPIIPAAPQSTTVTRHDGWTPDRQARFLRELGATHCVSRAARSVGMSRQSAYALRARSKGEPFDRAWSAALLCRFDALAEAAMERALNGVEVPHFHRGEVVGTSRRFDERLTVALLAMRESFRPALTAYPSDPSAMYGADAFGPLVERVERGPATWLEERLSHYEEDGDSPEDEFEADEDEAREIDEIDGAGAGGEKK